MSPFLEQIELQLHEALEKDELESLRPILNDEYPADLADAIERLELDDQYEVFRLLEPEVAAEVLNELGADSTRSLLERMHPTEVGDLLDEMPMDDAVEILTEDVPEYQEKYLAEMDPEDAAEVKRLMQYPPESAGLLMTERYVHISADITAAQALNHVRQVDEEVETVTDLYVLDASRHLIGVLSLREIITAAPEALIGDIMETDLVSVLPDTDQEKVARLVSRYNFLAMPVVDEANVMLGIITVDDIIDVLTEENTEDILRFGGVEGGGVDQPYFTIPLLKVIRSRFGWLLLLMVADTLTGTVMRLFNGQLSTVVALSFYIPLLIGTGGNTGSQTVSTIIRGLAVQDIRFRDLFHVLRRELLGGLLLGLALSVVAGLRAYTWDQDPQLALVVGLSIVIICTWANLMGSLIPMIAHRLGIDAAVVSAPMISTLVDATGLFIYLSIATFILGL
ncbi:MAG: magnesium transporter [Anaerolineae bacterium]|nr:magnesium transporter [Anaerolineae bacterium]